MVASGPEHGPGHGRGAHGEGGADGRRGRQAARLRRRLHHRRARRDVAATLRRLRRGPRVAPDGAVMAGPWEGIKVVELDRKSTRLNSSHPSISYAVFCLKKKNTTTR